jgi:AcrR family transcriptional regulator
MTTELILAEALKKSMATQSLDQITVKALTEKCGITRPTFYYHFRDIYDLLTWIYLNEEIPELDKVSKWSDAVMKIGRYCLANRTFVRQTYGSAGRDLLIEFLSNRLYRFHMRRFVELDTKGILSETAKKQLALFYSAALNAVLLDWIDVGMKESLAERIDALAKPIGDYLTELVKE